MPPPTFAKATDGDPAACRALEEPRHYMDMNLEHK